MSDWAPAIETVSKKAGAHDGLTYGSAMFMRCLARISAEAKSAPIPIARWCACTLNRVGERPTSSWKPSLSAITRTDYDAAKQSLTLWFDTEQRPFRFHAVPVSVHSELEQATCRDAYFRTFVRDFYRYSHW